MRRVRQPVIIVLVALAATCLTGCGGTEPRPDVQEQIALLRSPSLDDRYLALGNLQTLGADGQDAVGELRIMLKAAKDDDLAAEIAKTLGGMGPAAEAAVPELAALLTRTAMWPRYAAIEALGRMGGAAVPLLPRLTPLTKDPNRDVAAAAREAVRRLRRSAKKS